jgi:membrane fusion protein, multidrug efflux system
MKFILASCCPILIASTAGILCGCGKPPADGQKSSAPPPVAVQVVHPQRGEIYRSITIPADILPYQQATLYAKVAGYLKAIPVDKGDRVKGGDLLAEIEVPEMLADLAKYKAEVEVAKMDYQRIGDAFKKAPDLVVPQTVDNAKAKWDVAQANLEHTETLLNYTKIVAPFSGVITKRMVDPGAFIPAATSGSAAQNAAVVTLMDSSRVRVQAAVPEPEVPFISKGVPAKVTVEELAGRSFDGEVTRDSHALDAATKTMLAEIELPNPKAELRPGMYATAKLFIEKRTNALLIPVAALVVEKVGASVFTIAENKAKKTLVKIGFNDGTNAEVLNGLEPDEPIILAGKQALADGQPIQVKESK